MPSNPEKPSGGVRRVRRAGPRTTPLETTARPAQPEAAVSATAPPRSSAMFRGAVRYADVTVFLRQLIMLLEAGTPLLKSLHSLAQRGEKNAVRALVADIAQYVEMGNPLWQAFERHPRQFDIVFVNLIKASEASGTLVPVLQRLVTYRERREILRKRVRGGMLYPIILLFACFGVVLFVSFVVVPEFRELFSKFDVPLPAFTRYFMAVTEAIGRYWWLPVLVVVALILVYKLWYVQSPLRRLRADRMKLRIPIIGTIIRKNAIVQFTRTLSLLLKSGLSMMATLDLVRNAIHNRAVAQVVQLMRDSVERGEGLEQPLRESEDIVPAVVADMVMTGEESGRLDSISEQIADVYEEEVNIAIATLGDALQPILTVLIGILVIILALAVFVPLITMVEQLGAGGGA